MSFHPLLPIGGLVGFGWIIAIAVTVRGCESRTHVASMKQLAERMCECKDLDCVKDVERDLARFAEADEPKLPKDDALELFGAEQELKACRREVLKKFPR